MLAYETITQVAARIRSGELNPVEYAEALLERIAVLDTGLHAYIRVMGEQALQQAHAAQRALEGDVDLGPLHGIGYAAKDLFDVRGVPTTAGTRLLADNVATQDSTVVHKLAAAGMVLLGKTHTVQFAYGAAGINHDHGTPHNPWQREPHAPGGSSSGSAVAVAAGLAPMALGTDTGGSVRVPAALCGIVGLKTTVGRVSRAGVYPLSNTLDSVGPITRSVEDAALVFEAMQGSDERDASTAGIAPQNVMRGLKDGVKGLRVGVCETVFFDDVDPEVESAVREVAQVLRTLSAHVERFALLEAAAAWAEEKRPYLIAAEACAANRRFVDQYIDRLDPVIGPRMVGGLSLTAPDYVALIQRIAQLREQALWTLRDVDAFIVPTTMSAARPLSVIDADMKAYMDYNVRVHRNAGLGNLLNLCAVALPCGLTRDGLPVGATVYAKPFQEAIALRVAYAYEQASEWHQRRPNLGWLQPAHAH